MFLDDLRIGHVQRTQGITLTETMIIEFGMVYDPLPLHIDAVAAQKGPFAGLIASGFQTLALTYRLMHMTGFLNGGSVGGSGADELRWLRPVRVGDTLTVEAEIKDIRISKSKPDRATVSMAYTTYNQHGEAVMTATLHHLFRRRRAGET
ncbi:MAG: MaoC family dehydratase [Alphaproteobacteria bacterium]|nr:MaoC family dehydratase [Alphaproteobacteria bacterium]